MGLSGADLLCLFETTARVCATHEMRWEYLQFAKAHGLDILKGELHATTRQEKIRGDDGKKTWITKLVLTTAYTVFIQRCLDEGWVPVGSAAVCEKDDWSGWDSVRNLPVRHVTAIGARGKVVGAWFSFKHRKMGTTFGMYYPIEGIAQTDKDNNPTRSWRDMPDHMAVKTVGERVARFLLPGKLGTVHGDEERLGETIENTPLPNDSPPTDKAARVTEADFKSRRDDLLRRGREAATALERSEVAWRPIWARHGAPDHPDRVDTDNIDHFEAAVLDAEAKVAKDNSRTAVEGASS